MISNRSRPVLLHIRISQGEMLPTQGVSPCEFHGHADPILEHCAGVICERGPSWTRVDHAGMGCGAQSGGDCDRGRISAPVWWVWSVFEYMLLFSKFIHIFVPDLVSTVRVKRLTYVEKSIQSIYSFTDRCSVFYPTGWMLCSGKPLRRSKIFN